MRGRRGSAGEAEGSKDTWGEEPIAQGYPFGATEQQGEVGVWDGSVGVTWGRERKEGRGVGGGTRAHTLSNRPLAATASSVAFLYSCCSANSSACMLEEGRWGQHGVGAVRQSGRRHKEGGQGMAMRVVVVAVFVERTPRGSPHATPSLLPLGLLHPLPGPCSRIP